MSKGKNFVVLPFYCSHKFRKIVNYLIFQQVQKKNLSQLTKEFQYFFFKNCYYALYYMGWIWNFVLVFGFILVPSSYDDLWLE